MRDTTATMAMIAVLNASTLTPQAFQPFSGGPSAFERSLSAAASFPEVEKIVLLCGSEEAKRELEKKCPAALGNIVLTSEGTSGFPAFVAALESAASGSDCFYYSYADYPLLDGKLASGLHERHRGYQADYSFADGYPQGLAPEILRTACLSTLALLCATMPGEPGRDALFTILQKDINGFDIEADISPEDLRPFRLALCCDTKRDRLVAEALYGAGARDAESVLKIVPERRDLLRSLPAFYAVQVSSGCPQACSSCPYPKMRPDLLTSRESMPAERFEALMESIARFSDDAVIALSLWGEPALHPDFLILARSCLSRPLFRLVVETSGIGWAPELFKALADIPGASRIEWIVSLDAWEEESYERLRGKGFKEAMAAVDVLMGLFPDHVHVQALRMEENEEELEIFYRSWKEKNKNIIIQKYDFFCGFLAQKKVTDLSPLDRNACWHLMRDMNVLLDGSVPLCREDVQGSRIAGNVFAESMETVWERLGAAYGAQLRGEYEGICARCDEYYTYNF
jgi:spiro-SPASM protein